MKEGPGSSMPQASYRQGWMVVSGLSLNRRWACRVRKKMVDELRNRGSCRNTSLITSKSSQEKGLLGIRMATRSIVWPDCTVRFCILDPVM